jgi:inner membrane protein YhjD
VRRLDAYQRDHRWLGFPLAVLYKFYDDQGNFLAAIITYYGFVSLFPLMLLLATVLGIVLNGDPDLQARVLHSAVSQFPIVGTQLQRNVHSLAGNGFALGIGAAGSLYGGLGVVQAGHNAFNRVWAVPRRERPDPLHSRLRSLALLPVLGLGVLFTTALSVLTADTTSFLGAAVWVVAIPLSVAVNIVVFILAFRLLTARDLSVRDVAAGAVVAGVTWQALQSVGVYYLAHRLRGASAVAGLFGIVLGLVAWIYLQAVITVICAEINVVSARRLWPRSLASLFVDNADLTAADRAAYGSYATSERFKASQQITVRFDDAGEACATTADSDTAPVPQ